ncbi:phosphodiesterase YfcE [Thermacetogenium phaeum DSM 12270]|uniref:Phosphoesterase n=1 Tax=Thermacetogenium phaeum (strain ATCC BAA-254 / DSM 26808 / PB) TaxID=1089553 RepID=K4LCZ9_THEPS|nr:metallophosphoesterase [Thermacetogenium phaeum]AFV10663.1 phosphodiesterase YfcE [Thermacetogenium phaeum DSM 12270]
MRVGILSDSHGNLKRAEQAVRRMGQLDLLLHAGDYYEDALLLADGCGVEVKGVAGNCDRFAPGPEEQILEVEGYRIYLTHGHLFGVKRGLERLAERAGKVGASIVIYGHTHVPLKKVANGVLYLNPGSIAWPRITGRPGFAVLEFRRSGFSAEIYEL